MNDIAVKEMINETTQEVSGKLTLDPTLEIKITEAKNPEALKDLHGVGAYCPSSNFIQLSFDIDHPDYPEKSIKAARLALIHELHHASKRFKGIEIDKGTLYETCLYEGQADKFVYELTGEKTPWIEKAIDKDILELFEKEKDFSTTPELYKRWFLGETDEVPRWAGYVIGYELAE